jgi:hypothetical protein
MPDLMTLLQSLAGSQGDPASAVRPGEDNSPEAIAERRRRMLQPRPTMEGVLGPRREAMPDPASAVRPGELDDEDMPGGLDPRSAVRPGELPPMRPMPSHDPSSAVRPGELGPGPGGMDPKMMSLMTIISQLMQQARGGGMQ